MNLVCLLDQVQSSLSSPAVATHVVVPVDQMCDVRDDCQPRFLGR